jgi:survival-of-motor-neuron-related-splicing factor 30
MPLLQPQVEQLLLMDPENAELRDMYDGLSEVIELTQDLLKDAKEQHAAAGPSSTSAATAAAAAAEAPPPTAAAAAVASTSAAAAGAGPSSAALQQVQIITPEALNLPSNLPASVAAQIRRAQAKAALTGQAPAAWAVGAQVHALYTADGQYYPATVQGVAEGGKFVVLYEGYGNTEEVRRQQQPW